MSEFFQELFRNLQGAQPWWVWRPESATLWDRIYRFFNLMEGTCWLVFAALVWRRWQRHRRSGGEWAYAGSFVAFAIPLNDGAALS